MKKLISALLLLVTSTHTYAQMDPVARGLAAVALPRSVLNQPGGVPALSALGGLAIDPSNRPPTTGDDLRWYRSGDGCCGFQTNVVDQGALWGYANPGAGFQIWQMAQPQYNAASWRKVTAGLPCDSMTVLSCTAGISLYPLKSSFTGSPGTLYKLVNGVLQSLVIASPGSQGNDTSFAAADAFCAGTSFTWGNECKIIPKEQINNYAVTTDWNIVTATVAAAVGNATITSASNVMTVNTLTSGVFQVGTVITGITGLPTNVTISALGTGTGGTGTYTLSANATATTTGTVTSSGAGVGSASGAKSLTLNMSGCTTPTLPAVFGVTLVSGAISGQPTLENSTFTQQPGECANAGGSTTQTVNAGATFTVYPVFNVVWFPGFAPAFPPGPNLDGLRAIVWNTWIGTHDVPPAGFGAQNRILRVASATYNSASSFFALLGTSTTSTGAASAVTGGYYTMIATSDALNGLNLGGQNWTGIQSVATSSNATRCEVSNHAVLMQANVATVTVINENAQGIECWSGNDYIKSTPVFPGSSTTGFMFGSPIAPTASDSTTSYSGDALAMIMGTTPASNSLTGSWPDINSLRIALTKMGTVQPQSPNVAILSGGGTANNGGNGTTNSWAKLALFKLRSSGGQPTSLKAFNMSQSGALISADLTGFYSPSGAAAWYFDAGCQTAVTCVMEFTGGRVEVEHYCVSGSTGCIGSLSSASISGTTLTVPTSTNNVVAIGSIISGGTVSANTVVTGFGAGCYGVGACTYTVAPSQSSTCTSCTVTTTWAQVASQMAAEYKVLAYQTHLLGNGFYGLTAALPSTTGLSGTFVQGDRITLQPPTGSGITCTIQQATGASAYTYYPVLTINNVVSGVPIDWNILYPDHGACTAGTLAAPASAGTSSITQTGWLPSGGSGTWGSATFTLTLNHLTVPKAVIGRQWLQESTILAPWQEAVYTPIAQGGGGLYDDLLANATNASPQACGSIDVCNVLGQGYGADALHDQFGDTAIGANNYSVSTFNNTWCSNDNEHLTEYCNILGEGSYRKVLEKFIPYP